MRAFLHLGIFLRVLQFFDHKIVLCLLFRTIYSTKKEEKKRVKKVSGPTKYLSKCPIMYLAPKETSYIIEINVTLNYRYYLSWAVSGMFSGLVRLSTCTGSSFTDLIWSQLESQFL
jgi:hypothetical protein